LPLTFLLGTNRSTTTVNIGAVALCLLAMVDPVCRARSCRARRRRSTARLGLDLEEGEVPEPFDVVR